MELIYREPLANCVLNVSIPMSRPSGPLHRIFPFDFPAHSNKTDSPLFATLSLGSILNSMAKNKKKIIYFYYCVNKIFVHTLKNMNLVLIFKSFNLLVNLSKRSTI